MPTASMQEVLDTLRTRLRTFSSGGGTVADILGERVYFVSPPANATYPFGVLRYIDGRTSKAYSGERMKGILELLLIARPADATYAQALELAADRAQAAMQFFREGNSAPTTTGLIFVVDGGRDTLPPPAEPVDAQTYSIRLTWDVVIWPRYLTRQAHP